MLYDSKCVSEGESDGDDGNLISLEMQMICLFVCWESRGQQEEQFNYLRSVVRLAVSMKCVIGL